MPVPNQPLNLFINEPDIYEAVNFDAYPEIDHVFFNGQDLPHADINVVLVGLKNVIDDEFLKSFPNVKYLVSSTTGTDHIRTSRDIKIVNLDPTEIHEVSATAEFSLALLLSLVRKIPFIDPKLVADRRLYRGIQLRGKHLGIFGMGRLGSKMAKYAEALDMQWTGFDRHSSPQDKTDILCKCDIISIHLPLRKETIDFISSEEFNMMRGRPYIINTSRPQLINKNSLIHALQTDQISGLAMDFVSYDADNQWDPDLKKYVGEKLLLTPHIAGNTFESIKHTAQIVVDKLIRQIELDKSL